MEFLTASWWSALLAIVLIDLVLAGDNAIVIALAARNLPPSLRKKAIVWGTVGAIVVRSLMTLGVVADALMGIDNVLGVAGAAHGAFDLVVIGLLVSVPIVVFGSSVVLKLVERFPLIVQAGAAVLAYTAARMIIHEPLLDEVFDEAVVRWITYAAAIAGVLAAGRWAATRGSHSLNA